MPTPFTELTLRNISNGQTAYLAYDVTEGFKLFIEEQDGVALYYKDITDVSPPSSRLTLANNATANGSLLTISADTIAATAIVSGKLYKIASVGTTNFTAIGASANTVGTWFVATGAGSGTGTVISDFSYLSDQEGQLIKVNGVWCTLNEYISNTAIIVDKIVTTGTLEFPRFYPNVINETIIGSVTATTVSAGSFVIGKTYQILTEGTTNFTLIGSANNTVGTVFKATGVGTGTGTATEYSIEYYFSSLNNVPQGSLTTSGSYVGEPRIDPAGLLYIWDGTNWNPTGTGASEVVVSATAPSSPSAGMLWFRTTDSRMFLWNGTTWVQTIPGVSGTRVIDTSTVDGNYENETVIDSTDGNLYKWNGTSWVLVLESIVVDLSNQTHAAPSNFAGTVVDLTGASTQINVFSSGTNVTSLWTVTKSESAGVTGNLTTPGPHKLYTVTSLTADTAYVDFTLTRVGFADRLVRFSISRIKAGESGVGVTYRVTSNVNSFKYDNTNYTPTSIDLSAFQVEGSSAPVAYSGRFKIYYSTNGIAYTLDYTSLADESTKTYTLATANIKFLKVELFLAGGTTALVDLETYPVVIDGAPGAQGTAGIQGSLGTQGGLGPIGAQGGTGTQGPLGLQGNLGPTGPAGAQGTTGPTGIQGPPGTTGPAGAQGTTGPTGVQGAVGTTGPAGAQGTTGPTGQQGITGFAGSQGPTGIQGPFGVQGGVGPTGSQGGTGTQGPTGVQGTLGPAGSQGTAGSQGSQGRQGTLGTTGPAGAQGTTGPTGVQGAVGTAGPAGAQGTTGPTGVQGITGFAGSQGPSGIQGPFGVQGSAGPTGVQGPTGTAGPAGQQGLAGATGPAGPTGTTGPTGPGGAVGPAGSPGPTGASLFAYYSAAPVTALDSFPAITSWVSASTYPFNSIVHYAAKVYAMKTIGGITGLTTNPEADTTNWVQVFANGDDIGDTVSAGSFVTGVTYRIKTTGTTNFTLIGASSSTVGTTFVATGAGTGTGNAEVVIHTNLTPTIYVGGESRWRCVNNLYYWYANATQVAGGVTEVRWTIFATEVNSSNIDNGDFGNPILSVGETGPTGPAGPIGPAGAQGPTGVQGNVGPSGPQGTTGSQGSQGRQGVLGTTGPAGAQGSAGPQGLQGTLGFAGPAGPQGITGPTGVQGPLGTTGPAGAQGTTGPTGTQGTVGTTGPAGAQGTTGPAGQQGLAGPTGPAGAQGTTGPTGQQGLAGPTGPAGAQGTVGPTGSQGPVGTTGPAGAQGITGPTGQQGITGNTGPAGAQGTTGPTGVQGTVGTTGPAGAQGTTGPTGQQGLSGPTGATGVTGPPGPAGSSGNAVAFDVTGTYNNATGSQSRSDYIRLYRQSNLVMKGDVYWNVSNGEVWQWQSADDTSGNDLTLTKLVDWIDADSVKANSLSAITATIGLLRTATSGARTEIEDNVIRVYDSAGTLRVRMGIW